MLNLSAVLESSARDFPDRDAVVLGNARLSYSAIDAAANRVAHLLVARGIIYHLRNDQQSLVCDAPVL